MSKTKEETPSTGIVATGIPEAGQADEERVCISQFASAEEFHQAHLEAQPDKEDGLYEFPSPRGSQDWRDVVTAFIMRVGNYMLKNTHSEHYPLWGKQLKQHVEEIRAWYSEIPVPESGENADQRKKYEEAAKAHANTLFPGIQTSETHRHHNACVEDFMAGWKACSKDTEERVKTLTTALNKINDIRNSIIGYQSINWSAHIYPMVAALNEAGFEGIGYEEAKKMAKDQLARIKELEDRVEQAHNEAIDKALTTMKIAWREDRHEIYNEIQKLKL